MTDLLKYANHLTDCRYRGGHDCDCGLDEIRKAHRTGDAAQQAPRADYTALAQHLILATGGDLKRLDEAANVLYAAIETGAQPSPAATVETTDARRMRELAEEIEDSYQCTIVRDLLLDETDRRVIVKALNAVSTKSASAPCSSQNTAESSPPVMSGAAGAGTQCSAGNGGEK